MTDNPVQEVQKTVTFRPTQIVEAVNTAYPNLKIPGNADVYIHQDEGQKDIRIKWVEK